MEFSKNHTIWLKNTKMGRIFSSVLALKDFLSNSKNTLHILQICSVKTHIEPYCSTSVVQLNFIYWILFERWLQIEWKMYLHHLPCNLQYFGAKPHYQKHFRCYRPLRSSSGRYRLLHQKRRRLTLTWWFITHMTHNTMAARSIL